MTGDELSRIADVSEGLENPILRAAKSASNIAELLDAVKTKRYTLARLKRILFNALLGITREQQELAAYSDDALYIRVLGCTCFPSCRRMRLCRSFCAVPMRNRFRSTQSKRLN